MIQKYDTEKLNVLHEKFLTESGGIVAELSEQEAEEVQEKTSLHMITKSMLDDGRAIKEIANVRYFSVDTILGHIEKLREHKEDVKLDHTLPNSESTDALVSSHLVLMALL